MSTACRSVAIYGGSFDPVHSGHIMIASQVASLPEIDEVWLMVSPENPFKQGRRMAPESDRLEMARLAVLGLPDIKVSDFEFSLPRPSYTFNTLSRLREAYPDCQFKVIIGGDNWRDFAGWRNAREIIEQFGVIVYPRPDILLPPDFTPLPEVIPERQVIIMPDTVPQSEASSTAIRSALASGNLLPAMLPPRVAEYIRHHSLYIHP